MMREKKKKKTRFIVNYFCTVDEVVKFEVL